eukprot:359054-Chlamydomonas_euryale.AAC.8
MHQSAVKAVEQQQDVLEEAVHEQWLPAQAMEVGLLSAAENPLPLTHWQSLMDSSQLMSNA